MVDRLTEFSEVLNVQIDLQFQLIGQLQSSSKMTESADKTLALSYATGSLLDLLRAYKELNPC